MKQFFKKILVVPLIGTIVICNISANKSNWSGMGLSSDDINNSINFQLQRGSTCLSEFKKLQPVLNRFISQKIDAAYLSNVLGKPNNITQQKSVKQYHYYLTEKSDGCSVNFIVQNGSLISYNIENNQQP